MADQLLSRAQDLFEGQIDFEGQKLAELLTTLVLSGFGIVALVVGYIQENIHLTLWLGLAGTAITFFIVVPPWTAYRENPEDWLPAGTAISGSGIEVDGKKIN